LDAVIEEANWLSLAEDLESCGILESSSSIDSKNGSTTRPLLKSKGILSGGRVPVEGGFDALMCLGNSFAHLPDFVGDQRDQR
jgi:hypothetical protein